MYQFILFIHVMVASFIILLVLVQQGKGATMGAAFGSGASSTVFGARGTGSVLYNITMICIGIFFVTSITMNYFATSAYKEAGKLTPVQHSPVPVRNPSLPVTAPATLPAQPATTDASTTPVAAPALPVQTQDAAAQSNTATQSTPATKSAAPTTTATTPATTPATKPATTATPVSSQPKSLTDQIPVKK